MVRELDPRRSADLTGHHWYYSDMSREWAEWILGSGNSNKFLVRLSPTHLVLSMKVSGWMYHSIIRCTPEGYRLEERREIFKTVPEMIAYYRKLPVKKKQVLGTACDRRSLGECIIHVYMQCAIELYASKHCYKTMYICSFASEHYI